MRTKLNTVSGIKNCIVRMQPKIYSTVVLLVSASQVRLRIFETLKISLMSVKEFFNHPMDNCIICVNRQVCIYTHVICVKSVKTTPLWAFVINIFTYYIYVYITTNSYYAFIHVMMRKVNI